MSVCVCARSPWMRVDEKYHSHFGNPALEAVVPLAVPNLNVEEHSPKLVLIRDNDSDRRNGKKVEIIVLADFRVMFYPCKRSGEGGEKPIMGRPCARAHGCVRLARTKQLLNMLLLQCRKPQALTPSSEMQPLRHRDAVGKPNYDDESTQLISAGQRSGNRATSRVQYSPVPKAKIYDARAFMTVNITDLIIQTPDGGSLPTNPK
ncbi:hypothetical protein EVAR_4999_1 [Eumeta japonica]|uniref:Uncharacterized protein n=1 Tax=Eumeta variegata TaxID=151549 RepID=A0A4C1UZT5_EUMVA|nr:hypothetical protein EVAR_4999_1 [Eumeta japonica]